MKRLAWLLLALSLPAWATINGVDSSRVVLPSFDGTRYGAYVAGDYPETPPGVIWTQDFEGIANGTVFSKANMDSTYEALEGLGYNSICDAGITISNTVARHGSQSMKVFNDISVRADGNVCTDSATKARVELILAANAYKLNHNIGDGLGFALPSERWFGYSVYFPTAGNSGWSTSNKPFILQIFGSGSPTSDPASTIVAMQLGANGVPYITTEFSADPGDLTSAHDYLFSGGHVWDPGWSKVTSSAAWAAIKENGAFGYHLLFTSSGSAFSRDKWYDVIVHLKKGSTAATGQLEIWVRDVATDTLTKAVDVPAFPSSRDDFPKGFMKTGFYIGVKPVSETYTMYVDSWRAYDEQGTFNAVDPAQDD